MRSVSEDLTARARIRDAAIEAFARDGFDRTSMRSIAAEAGVSAALIVHHFGDKATLRAACDEHVVAELVTAKQDIGPSADLLRHALDDVGDHASYVDYLGRMLVDDTPASADLFDRLLTATRDTLAQQTAAGTVREVDDPDGRALVLTLYGLGPVLLRHHLTRTLGGDRLTTAMLEQLTMPALDLFTHGMFTSDTYLTAARDAIAHEPATATTAATTPPPTHSTSHDDPPRP